MDIDAQFREGMTLRDFGKLAEARTVFKNIIDAFSSHEKIAVVYEALAGVYLRMNDKKNALTYFQKAATLDPSYEMASLGLYISYVELKEYDLAMGELSRYLERYPANLYKSTLQELIADLHEGYALKFKDQIERFARKNQIHFSVNR